MRREVEAVPFTDNVAPGAVFKIPIRELVVSNERNGIADVEVAKEKALRAVGIVLVEDEAYIMLIPERRMDLWAPMPVEVAAIDRRAPGVLVPMPI